MSSFAVVCTIIHDIGPIYWCVNDTGSPIAVRDPDKPCRRGKLSLRNHHLSLQNLGATGCASPGRPGVPSIGPVLGADSFRITVQWRDPGKYRTDNCYWYYLKREKNGGHLLTNS